MSKELPSDVWRFIENAEEREAAVALYDENDNIIFTNPEYRRIYKYADFSVPQTYDSVTWKVVEAGLVDDHVFLSDPQAWLRGAHNFRSGHRLAQYIVHHNTGRTYLAHHQLIEGVGKIAIRFDFTKKIISNEMREDFHDCNFDIFHSRRSRINFHHNTKFPSAVVSITGKLIDANKEFMDIIERDDGVSILSGRLSIDSLSCNRTFYEILERTSNTSGKSSGDVIKIPRKDGKKIYIISIRPLRASMLSSISEVRGASLVSFMDPDFQPTIDPEIVQKIFDLTAAEARVAVSIAHGSDLAEIALSHNVSVGTVRNQLKVIFSKTGVSRQAELVRLIYNINRMNHIELR